MVSIPRSEVIADRLSIDLRVGADSGREVDEDGSCLELKLYIVSCDSQHKILQDSRTDWKVFFPSTKSNVPNRVLVLPSLSPLSQLLPNRSHSGWNSRQRTHPNLVSSAVSSTTAEKSLEPLVREL